MIYLLDNIYRRWNTNEILNYVDSQNIISLSDFLFFLRLIIHYIKKNKEKKYRLKKKVYKKLKKYISVLIYICIKYLWIIHYLEDYNFRINSLQSIILDKFLLSDDKEQEYSEEELVEEDDTQNKLIQKILVCKKTSRTREKGRINRFKVIIILHAYNEQWFGIGEGKDFYLQNALLKARIKAFKNIYFTSSLRGGNTIQEFVFRKKNYSVRVFHKKSLLPSFMYPIRSILETTLNNDTLSVVKKGTINITKLIKLLIV